MPRCFRIAISALCLALLLAGAGCLQLETTVSMHEDGSATVTERLNFSRKLLDMDAAGVAAPSGAPTAGEPPGRLLALLSREAAAARMKTMGEGVTLVSHAIRDGEKGSRESVAVYKVADIQNFVYPSPFLAARRYPGILKFSLSPYLKHGWADVWPAGSIIVNIQPAYPGKERDDYRPPDPLPPPPSPRELQAYRELVPVFRDMLEDFQLKVRFESYAPIVETRGIVHRSRQAAVSYLDILSVSDRDLDKYGYNIFENEEILAEIIRWHLSGDDRRPDYAPFIADHLAGQGGNLTLPVFHSRAGGHALIRPSLPLFRRYFEGKTLENRGGTFQANFDQIGYHPEKGRKQP